jgi:hypothetical protein
MVLAITVALALTISEADASAFVAGQEAAWNAKDAARWAATFLPDARFVEQARASDNSIVPTGSSSLAQATAQARRFFARERFRETARVTRVQLAPDKRSAKVFGYETSHIESLGKPERTLCAETEQTLVLQGGRILSRGQTDTAVRCNAGPR